MKPILQNRDIRTGKHCGGFVHPTDTGEVRCFFHGNVYNHPRVQDPLANGTHVHTSAFVSRNEELGTIQTRNTEYELGEMSEEYAAFIDGNLAPK